MVPGPVGIAARPPDRSGGPLFRGCGRPTMATGRWPGLGPVFVYEWLTASRRWQGYALRSLLVSLLLLGLTAVWLGSHDGSGDPTVQQLAEIGRAFYAVTTLILLGLVGLAAP